MTSTKLETSRNVIADSRTLVQVEALLQASPFGGLLRQYTEWYVHDPKSGSTVPPYIRRILTQALLQGYNIYKGITGHKSNPLFLQKCHCNDKGDKLFFIEIQLWDLCLEYKNPSDLTQGIRQTNLSPKAQFRNAMEHTANLDIFVNSEDTLETIEAFFMHFYRNMWCEPYERAP